MNRRVSTAVLCLLVGASGVARAGSSSFRVVDSAKPIAGGARVKLRYDNNWGSPQRNTDNSSVRLWLQVSDTKPQYGNHLGTTRNGMFRAKGAKQWGVVEMLGRGRLEIDVKYSRFGLQPGDTLWISGCWLKSGHIWGDFWFRTVGSVTLPAAKSRYLQINSATLAELCELPGIGQASARKIIAQRNIAPIRSSKALEALLGAKRVQALKGALGFKRATP
ncbi:MAG: helix-hairpin-helix domain-containing protein [Deltaproteobacteria bacterium]|nr:helix-hairpin-helix domain-containing protein [Deltaproteobacteria bacterium]